MFTETTRKCRSFIPPLTPPRFYSALYRSKPVSLEKDFRERFGMLLEVSDRCIDWLESRSRTGIIRRDITNVVKRYFDKSRLAIFTYERRHQLKPGRILLADVPAGQNDIGVEIREGNQDDIEG